ncbi:hypothetical protein OF83DRAFT_1133735 [Amylostereum chailletii]|nr:hypothetical protein OF83DRAFT_1133735 [Amylostereum chailletii]
MQGGSGAAWHRGASLERHPSTAAAPGTANHTSARPGMSSVATAGLTRPYDGSAPAFASLERGSGPDRRRTG